jgi:hypothetical protein
LLLVFAESSLASGSTIRGIDVTLQMFHPPTLVPVQL